MRWKTMDRDSAEYKELYEKHQQEEKERSKRAAYKHKLVMAILTRVSPAQRLSVSKLKYLSVERLTAIGKAATALRDELQKAGLITYDFKTYDNPDFDGY